MNRSASRRDHLGSLIFDMEESVANLARWGRAIRDIGTSDVDIDPQGLYVIGLAIIAQADQVKADWEQCFELSRYLRESGR